MFNKTRRGDIQDKRIAQTNWLILGFAFRLMEALCLVDGTSIFSENL